MILSIECPNCNKKLQLTITNNKIISVEVDGVIHLSQDEIENILDGMNIHFG